MRRPRGCARSASNRNLGAARVAATANTVSRDRASRLLHSVLRSDRQSANPGHSRSETRNHHYVRVQAGALDAADAPRREAVSVLQPAELALNCGAALVEVAPATTPY